MPRQAWAGLSTVAARARGASSAAPPCPPTPPYPIASLMDRYWVIDTPGKNIDLRPPYTLMLVSAQNQRLATRLESLKPQTLDVQFG